MEKAERQDVAASFRLVLHPYLVNEWIWIVEGAMLMYNFNGLWYF